MAHSGSKNILLGITGGIAAYKSAEIIRRLKDHGHHVQVVTTPAAEAFITPLTLQAVSGKPVRSHLLDANAEAGMGHIELAKWADIIVIAPASADFIARATHGLANDLLSTLCLASECPIALAPAMNQAMWRNAITQQNLSRLASYPHIAIWGPASGEQACGDNGPGRMLEPAEVVRLTLASLNNRHNPPGATENNDTLLDGKTVLITAGPTREAIDPVRYLSNESSGKMGYAIAQAAIDAGGKVILISGPTRLDTPPGVERLNVTSALEMNALCEHRCGEADIIIGAAAVADFRPAEVAAQKMKKGDDDLMTLTLIKNPDIIANMMQQAPHAYAVGFAAETENLALYAVNKLQRKGLDMIIANDVSQSDIGFNSEHNAATVFWREQTSEKTKTVNNGAHHVELTKMSKQELAQRIIKLIAGQIAATKTSYS